MTEQVKQNHDKSRQISKDVKHRLLEQYKEKGKQPIHVEPPSVSLRSHLYRSKRR